MEFLDSYIIWVKGEILQARFMLLLGIILLAVTVAMIIVYGIRPDSRLIPIALAVFSLIAYGGFIITDRNKRLSLIQSEIYEPEHTSIIAEEKEKIEGGIRSCKITIRLWSFIIILATIFIIVVSDVYYRQLAVGLLILGITLLTIDIFIDQRAKVLFPQFDLIQTKNYQ